MPVVKEEGLTASAWQELIELLENVHEMMRVRGKQLSSLDTVLKTSFDALTPRKQEEILKTAVSVMGAHAPIEMMLNLWGTKMGCGVIPTRW